MMLKRAIPLAFAIATGLLTLVALLVQLPALYTLLLGWAMFLATIALLLGVLNLLSVHLWRIAYPGETSRFYSVALVLGMVLVFAAALADAGHLTSNSLNLVFSWVQAPLEAAFAALLPLVLLFSGFQLLKRQRTLTAAVFLITAVFTLLYHLLRSNMVSQPPLQAALLQLGDWLENIVALAGMRGLLLGIALGTITLGIRILAGWERPYQP